MPAKSKAQQRLFGMVHAYQKGELTNPPEIVREVAEHISEEDAEHFARTKRKRLPERKEKRAELLKKAYRAIESFMEGDRYFAPGPTRVYHCSVEKGKVKAKDIANTGFERHDFNLSAKTAEAEYGEALSALLRKVAAGQRVVATDGSRRAEFNTLEEAASFLSSLGATPESEIRRMLSDRAGLINGMRIAYPSSSSEKADPDKAFGESARRTLSMQAGEKVNDGLIGKIRSVLSSLG